MTGTRNVAVGYLALTSSTASDNTALGYRALDSNTTGVYNTAIGPNALSAVTVGTRNFALGANALLKTTGSRNVGVGISSLYNNTSGTDNAALGYQSGYNQTTGSNNVAIANTGVAGDSGRIRIGTAGQQTSAFMSGIHGISITGPTTTVLINGSGQLGTATASSSALKKDVAAIDTSTLGRLLALNPVSHRYKGTRELQYGLIAEDVARTMPAITQFDTLGRATGVHYDQLTPLLLAQVQRLTAENRRQDRAIARLLARLGAGR